MGIHRIHWRAQLVHLDATIRSAFVALLTLTVACRPRPSISASLVLPIPYSLTTAADSIRNFRQHSSLARAQQRALDFHSAICPIITKHSVAPSPHCLSFTNTAYIHQFTTCFSILFSLSTLYFHTHAVIATSHGSG
ncbi:hypothetical protein P153DRAFT_23472 [Dothidotthia symphoricarpi CBS 119687]|uniref:Uncharacterized protein n=1 Tax=Dothidotthia symphoricarpi CBS 119687 TaxID=1392245 RepID=A0A6A6AED3_9PLEO|nr:uncharacterized protein P153DRAFT_23472 [Dothidotthia symphoricarpi CBS 119687]KAF2129653.1 hypothetical protein P153DRAFT_23472 [Dothidotthia symphoricarpi CBS 119687]